MLTSSDQEVIIMCKPSTNQVEEDYFDETLNYIDDDNIVVGEVENKQLKYEVSLYKQVDDDTDDDTDDTGPVTIGTLLQLRVRLLQDTDQWRHVWLVELILSPSRSDHLAPGHVKLVSGGCRVTQFSGIVPRSPWSDQEAEVRVNFEAVMLDVDRRPETLMWVHVVTRVCRSESQCQVSCDSGARSVRSIGDHDGDGHGLGSLLTVRQLQVEY